MKKRALSLLLALLMCLSLLPATALAAEGEGTGDSIDFAAFLALLTADTDGNISYDGSGHDKAVDGKLTVKWSPASGCYHNVSGHTCVCAEGSKTPTGNTPKRLQSTYAQYQILASAKDVSISNVNFVYVPAEVSICTNTTGNGWGGQNVTPALAEIQLQNSGNTTFTNCSFDKVTASPYGKGDITGNTNADNTATFTGCAFANITNKYAIKDVRAGTVKVESCTFTDCGGGIYLEGATERTAVEVKNNAFANIGDKGLIQFSANGNYSGSAITLSGNSATNCDAILRQLNDSVNIPTDSDNWTEIVNLAGNSDVFTTDSTTRAGVAMIGNTAYSDLATALAAVTKDAPLSWVSETVWDKDKPVYYNGTFYSGSCALESAMAAANDVNSSDAAKIYVRPNYAATGTALVDSNHHQAISTDMIIYGNNAKLNVGWEPCVEYPGDSYPTMSKDISIAIYNLHNGAGVWGIRTSSHTLNVTMENCNNVHELMINGNQGSANSVTNYTIVNCTFDKTGYAADCPITTTTAGKVVVKDCTFSNFTANYVLNINNKNGGTTEVEAADCEFKSCGLTVNKKYIVRLTGDEENSTVTGKLNGLTFDAPSNDRAIILGDADSSSGNNASVSCSIENTNGKLTVYEKNSADADDTKVSVQLTTDDAITADNSNLEEGQTSGLLTVSFESSSVADKKVTYGTTITLPTATKSGHTFKGWTLDGTTYNAGATYEVVADTTFTAAWQAIPTSIGSVSTPTYAVTATAAEHGSVAASAKSAAAGATVTVTVTPDEGYVLETLSATDAGGNTIEVTNLGDGKYSFKMPAAKVTVTATFMDDNTMLNFFVDVPAEAYYYDAVLWAAKNGITTGVDETHFAPNRGCTRAQLAALLYRYAQSQGKGFTGAWMFQLSFTDVPELYYEAVAWCYMNGIVLGYSDDQFGSQDIVTRQQTVAILYRFAEAMGYDVSVGEDTNILSFNDALTVSEYATEAFQWATGAGIVQGNNGNLLPKDTCTRGQLVAILYRMLGE